MRVLSFFAFLFAMNLAQAQTAGPAADGNLIAEPELKDYQAAHRTPGILYEPYDVIDANGKPVQQ